LPTIINDSYPHYHLFHKNNLKKNKNHLEKNKKRFKENEIRKRLNIGRGEGIKKLLIQLKFERKSEAIWRLKIRESEIKTKNQLTQVRRRNLFFFVARLRKKTYVKNIRTNSH
jgi:hypothetical protein